MSEPIFESIYSIEEIKNNFEKIDFFIDSLNEILNSNINKNKGSQ